MAPAPQFPDLFSLYNFITPADVYGKIKFDNRLGPNEGTQRDPQKNNVDSKLTEIIMEQFVTKCISGAKSVVATKNISLSAAITNDGQNQGSNPTFKDLISLSEKGVYNALYQAALKPNTEYLTPHYWSFSKQTPSVDGAGKPLKDNKGKPIVKTEYSLPGNFLGQVCGSDVTQQAPGPPIDLTVALMRAPMLSPTRSNTHIIQLYLTAMPPHIANRLTPYCDVEFQIPFLHSQDGRGAWDEGIVNRPSLYRFLMGSGKHVNELTDADKSLTLVYGPNQQARAQARRSDEKEQSGILNAATTSFFGAEMFTTPQTLVNMDKLNRTGQGVTSGARLTTAKPFMPPATIANVSITVQNAGAGTFGKRGAALSMRIHDKARLAEFGEFFRGNKGYSEATVWITYGMLAPRGGPDDEYAKMINQNMLVREAYMVSQTAFTFNMDGSIDVNLTLSQKVTGQLSIATISLGSSITNVKIKLSQAIGYIRNNVDKYGPPRTEKEGFSAAEVRIAQYISAVAEGNLDPGTDQEKLKKEFKEIDELLQNLEASTKPGPKGAAPTATLQDIKRRRPGFDITTVKEMISKLKEIYGVNTTAKEQPQGLKDQFKSAGVNYALNKLTKAAQTTEPDPFYPDAAKNIIQGASSIAPLKAASPPVRNFSDRFIEVCKTSQTGTREFVSFGKIFCMFCVEPMLYSVANEFGWTKDQQAGLAAGCPYEMQVIFYQLNKNCGPASGHNIAELPLDITIFSEAYGQLAEARGGDDATLVEFIEFLNDQLSDPRHPGYGRRTFYKPIPDEKKSDKEKRFDLQPINDKNSKFEDNVTRWTKDYGSSFVTPQLTVSIEVEKEGAVRGMRPNSTSNNDLLFNLAGRIGAGNADAPPRQNNDPKTIVKIHVFDRTFSPFENVAKVLKQTSDGNYVIFDTEDSANLFALKEKEEADKSNEAPQKLPSGYVYSPGNPPTISVGDEQIGVVIGTGKQALKEYLGALIPKIDIGTNGSLISSVALASKTSGLEGTIAMQGGTQKRELSIGTTGLSQEQFNQPMVVYPAQLQMTTMGCPIAEMQQHFFFDFGTDTTIDNNYVVQKVTHNIMQGKFETQWEFGYYDGYGRMFNAGKIIDLLGEVKAAMQPPAPVNPVIPPVGPNSVAK